VGISGRIEHGSNLDSYLNSVVYIPFREESPAAASLIVRSALPPHAIADAIRREVQGLDADQPLQSAETVAQVWARDRWWFRTWGAVYGTLAAIAVLLSAVGLYAVMAQAVARRTQEIGLRMAVGAQRWQVSWLILRRGLGQLAIGLALGLASAVALGRVLRVGLVAISPTDPLTLTSVTALLTIVSVAACLLPAWRAMLVDPVVALRAD
jgi:ABC-type antimicrobial peptide transport system permease subunit